MTERVPCQVCGKALVPLADGTARRCGMSDLNAELLREAERLEAALADAMRALSRIRTPGAVALTRHKDVDAPYVRDLAETAMLDAKHSLDRWKMVTRRAEWAARASRGGRA